MKRGKPLPRGRPLKRGKPLARRTPLKAAPKKQAGPRQTGPDRNTVEAVYDRSGHSCECCGAGVGDRRGIDHHIHHRRPRAMGGTRRKGTNSAANLLVLCPGCHESIESHREQALLHGFLLVQTDNPALVPVLIRGDRWVHLTHDGRYSRTPAKETAS